MSGLLRTVGVSMLTALAIPVGGLSGFMALLSLSGLIFSSEFRSIGGIVGFLMFAGVAYVSFRVLQAASKRADRHVEELNAKEGLSLNPQNKLGYPSAAFLVFDAVNRKLAFCNSVTGDYRIYELSYILGWRYEWGIGQRMHVNSMGGALIPGTNISQPTVSHSAIKKGFELVLELADENRPILKFAMQSEAQAKRWCAILNAVYNG